MQFIPEFSKPILIEFEDGETIIVKFAVCLPIEPDYAERIEVEDDLIAVEIEDANRSWHAFGLVLNENPDLNASMLINLRQGLTSQTTL